MKKTMIFTLCCLPIWAQADVCPRSGQTMTCISEGTTTIMRHGEKAQTWQRIKQVHGDLNGDGLPDKAEVWQLQEPGNIIRNENGLGADTLDTNPRRLDIALNNGHGSYDLLVSDRNFILPAANADSPCGADPLLEQGSVAIDKGRLKITQGFWYSCGSWYATTYTHTFRYEKQKMRLIGSDVEELHRGSGEINTRSTNYLTARQKTTTGENIKGGRVKVKWTTLPPQPFYSLGGNMPLSEQD